MKWYKDRRVIVVLCILGVTMLVLYTMTGSKISQPASNSLNSPNTLPITSSPKKKLYDIVEPSLGNELVLFYTKGNDGCASIKDDWEKIKKHCETTGECKATEIDASVNPTIVNEHGVMYYPTIRLYKNGFPASMFLEYPFTSPRSFDGMLSFLRQHGKKIQNSVV